MSLRLRKIRHVRHKKQIQPPNKLLNQQEPHPRAVNKMVLRRLTKVPRRTEILPPSSRIPRPGQIIQVDRPNRPENNNLSRINAVERRQNVPTQQLPVQSKR